MSNRIDLKCLPAVDEVLRHESIVELLVEYPRRQLKQLIRETIDDYRQLIVVGDEPELRKDSGRLLQAVVDTVHARIAGEEYCGLQKVINATGVLLHTNLGRAPLADAAISRIQEAVAFTNLEMDLASGKRSRRGDRASRLLADLTGAEDAVVVNNCAAATMLVLQAIASGREVIVSRGQLVEIGGGFRLPEVFTAAGVWLKEVGTTNRTYLRDYEQAIGEHTGAIIRVHRSNFSLTGFVTEPAIEELVTSKRPADIPVIDDLGSGLVTDLSGLGIHEPTVLDSVAAGSDLCLFSGDKLFGGPQCGIIVGKRKWTDRLRSCPLMRAMRVDKLTLAALEATTEIHLAGRALELLPLYRMLSRPPNELEGRCISLRNQLGTLAAPVAVTSCLSTMGGGSLPGFEIPSFGLSLHSASTAALASRLRCGKPAVHGRQTESRLLLDLRTVLDHELPLLGQRLAEVLSANGEESMPAKAPSTEKAKVLVEPGRSTSDASRSTFTADSIDTSEA